ncbi:MAG: putative glycosyl transferase [Ilumatobacteraceae bacterium]|nr:putative glycosyl transferase [Ilumatobacteraceae bacterium]
MTLSGADVSVVIPAFNAARFIDATIDSIVTQTERPAEIIVVDDGSTDATASRCRAWAPDVTLVQQANAGPGRARNVAVGIATGSVLSFVDADDTWTPRKIELQLAHLTEHPDHVAVFGWMQNYIDPDASLSVGPRTVLDARPAFQPSTMTAHRSLMNVVGPFDEIGPMQGWIDWYMRLRESGLPIGMVDELVTMRRIHGDNMTLRDTAHQTEYHRFLHASLQRRRRAEG